MLWQVVFWAVLTILLVIVEIVTVQLVAVWFAAGSLAAFISSLFQIDFLVQIVIFIIISVILLAATRPVVKKILKGKKVHTNADRDTAQIHFGGSARQRYELSVCGSRYGLCEKRRCREL